MQDQLNASAFCHQAGSLLAVPFERTELELFFSDEALSKGQRYYRLGAVVDYQIDLSNCELTGSVQGTQRYPYEVTVVWEKSNDGKFYRGSVKCRCSCPLAFDCMHAACLMLAAIDEKEKAALPEENEPAAGTLSNGQETTGQSAPQVQPAQFIPTLKLFSQTLIPHHDSGTPAAAGRLPGGKGHFTHVQVACAELTFNCQGMINSSAAGNQARTADNYSAVWRQDSLSARTALEHLAKLGFVPAGNRQAGDEFVYRFTFPHGNPAKWLQFMETDISSLKLQGWRIDVDPTFPFRTVKPDCGLWTCELEDEGGFWFSLALGIYVDGKKIPLLPVLLSGLKAATEHHGLQSIEQLNCHGQFLCPLPDGRVLILPFDRVRLILNTLGELTRGDKLDSGGRLPVSLLQAYKLAEAAQAGLPDKCWSWQAPERLQQLVELLRSGIQPKEAPSSFGCILRDYQKYGLGWLQLLRQGELGGILADDMGLGKTVQTLAHLALEKEQGRLNQPALVVCPTSVVPNWLKEAQSLASNLQVVCLHGRTRADKLNEAAYADLVITTYSLLQKDYEQLSAIKWSALILDESQAIKNPRSQTAVAACTLPAGYRICLTGTPIENHLGDLWSQLNFLMPGILGSQESFWRNFRAPIEENHNRDAERTLSGRIAPFVLRRTKSAVAGELPQKTEMLKQFELEGDQRDLYETVRLAMYERVRDAIAQRGFKQSRVVILEALLKLRQVCCDPRLVKLETAAKVRTSAKLSLLMSMLDELLEQGRRILLFSQFTSMLDLIKIELKTKAVPYVEIRGDTVDRNTPVKQFQDCAVPLFLLSLKAGGRGLNLTAADTVIHYDQWWNPAVENQATDRAHRIGQNKPIFVYKLIALGTIEEKMLELHERKRAVAEVIYSHGHNHSLPLTEADLKLFFTPLPF